MYIITKNTLCLFRYTFLAMLLTYTQKIIILAATVAFFITGPTVAQHSLRMEWGVRNDNDLYLLNKQDQYYTNGLMLTVLKAVDSAMLSSRELNRLWGVNAGQKMYTAFTGQIHAIEEVDRPITAYLFIGAHQRRFYVKESTIGINLELGIIGRYALGKQPQESIHRAFNLYEVSGWEYQLKDAFGIDVGIDYARLLYRNR